MQKGINTHGSTVFHANAKSYTAPSIEEIIFDDDNNEVYILSNGRTQLADSYNALWNPKRTAINWKAKGKNPDRTKIDF